MGVWPQTKNTPKTPLRTSPPPRDSSRSMTFEEFEARIQNDETDTRKPSLINLLDHSFDEPRNNPHDDPPIPEDEAISIERRQEIEIAVLKDQVARIERMLATQRNSMTKLSDIQDEMETRQRKMHAELSTVNNRIDNVEQFMGEGLEKMRRDLNEDIEEKLDSLTTRIADEVDLRKDRSQITNAETKRKVEIQDTFTIRDNHPTTENNERDRTSIGMPGTPYGKSTPIHQQARRETQSHTYEATYRTQGESDITMQSLSMQAGHIQPYSGEARSLKQFLTQADGVYHMVTNKEQENLFWLIIQGKIVDKATKVLRNRNVNNYATLREALIKSTSSTTTPRLLLKKLDQMHRKNATVKTFCEEVEEIYNQLLDYVEDHTPTERIEADTQTYTSAAINAIIEGLDEIGKQVARTNPKSLEDAIEIALREELLEENIEMRKGDTKGPPPQRYTNRPWRGYDGRRMNNYGNFNYNSAKRDNYTNNRRDEPLYQRNHNNDDRQRINNPNRLTDYRNSPNTERRFRLNEKGYTERPKTPPISQYNRNVRFDRSPQRTFFTTTEDEGAIGFSDPARQKNEQTVSLGAIPKIL